MSPEIVFVCFWKNNASLTVENATLLRQWVAIKTFTHSQVIDGRLKTKH